MKKRKNNNGVFYVVISLVACLAVGTGVFAYVASQNINVAGNYIYNEASGQNPPAVENQQLGAISGTDVYEPVWFHEGINTTWDQEVHFSASTTKNVLANGNDLADVGASFYASKDMICENPTFDIKTAIGNGTHFWSFSVGTTTRAGDYSWTVTSTQTLIASTTIGHLRTTVASSTNGNIGFINAFTNPGTFFSGFSQVTTTQFLLQAGQYVVVNVRSVNATSSNAYAENDIVSKVHMNCWPR